MGRLSIFRIVHLKCDTPDSVTSIGECAFASCYSLSNVTLGNALKSIDYGTFEYCSHLVSITIPDSVTDIGERAFASCYSLSNVTLGNAIQSIGQWAFYGCYGMRTVTIPDSVAKIGYHAFGYSFDIDYEEEDVDDDEDHDESDNTIIKGFTIYGTLGSCAEAYAKENKILFKEIVSAPPTPTPTPTLSISFPNSTETGIGYTLKLAPVIEGSTATVKVKYKSNKKYIAVVDSSGKVTPVSTGTAKITASIKDGKKTYKATCKIKVKQPVLKFPLKTLTIKKGSSVKLDIEVEPATKVTWSVRNNKIASVTEDGVVTAVKKGITYAYARAHGMKKKLKIVVV